MRYLILLLLMPWPALAAEPGELAGPVELQTYDGRALTMNNYGERRATVLLFLSTRTETSEQAITEINDLNTKFRLREILLVGVFPHAGEGGEEIRRFTQHNGMIFPAYVDPMQRAARKLGVRTTPEAFLIDKAGMIQYRGAVSGLAKAIAALVANQPIETKRIAAEGTPLTASAAARTGKDPYDSVSFSSELIFDKIPMAAGHHASTIVEAANGDLLVVWYGGSFESSDDEALYLARRKKGDRSWSKPEVLARDSLQPPGNAAVFRDGRDRIWIVWGRMESSRPIRRGAGWGQCRLMYRISNDHGKTWSQDQDFEGLRNSLPRNVAVTLKNGDLIFPLSGRLADKSGSFFLITSDHGKTWSRSSVIAGGSQPTLVERNDGTLLALMRRGPRIMQSVSSDAGRTWLDARQTELKNPNAGIAMTSLKSGSVVLVFNDSEKARTPLSIVRSRDGGSTWEEPLKLEANPGEYSYPSVIQSADGRIHITYTFRRYSIKHVEMNEGWLEHLKRPN